MNNREMFGDAKWVTPGNTCPAPRIRGRFTLKKPGKAVITICGLGFFELYINGKRASQDVFVPVTSDYHHVPGAVYAKQYGEELGHRIYCLRYDISALVQAGENIISVFLGPGWYGYYDDKVKLCYKAELEDEDGVKTVCSDESVKWSESFITSYCLERGETHDYTVCAPEDNWMYSGYDDSGWHTATVIDAPDSHYYIQDCPADTVIRHIKPKLIHETDTVYIYDAGENITGWPVVHCDSIHSETVRVRVGEELTADGLLDEAWVQNQESVFVTGKRPLDMHNRFTWQAFRYIEVTKNACVTDCMVIHADIGVTSGFRCDNETLNWIFDAYIRTQLDNMHAGIPSDCPHLERRGYTGDGQLCCETVMLLFDAQRFYKKWIQDISDCQDRKSGHVQYTAPYTHCGGGPGGWGCAIIEVPYMYYKAYGDKEPLEACFDQMLHYLDYLEAHSEHDLVVSDQPGLWCLGEWCTPSQIGDKRPLIPAPFVNNYFYVKSIQRVLEIAELIGRKDGTERLRQLEKIKADAIVRNYFDEATGDFAENIEGANGFALEIGLGDARTFEHIVKHYSETGVLDTGIFGTNLIPYLLFDRGYQELALSLLTTESKPSFHYWMEQGATTLWEEWFKPRSMNHPMFGAVVRTFFYFILGIRQKAGGAGYESLVIEPNLTKLLNFAEGYITTKNGKVSVRVNRTGKQTYIKIELDEGVEAALLWAGKTYPLHAGENTFAF